jgi:anti-anti-sigma factor
VTFAERTSAPSWDGHLLLLHQSEDERRSQLAAWVRHGLEHGEKVVYTQADPATSARSLVPVLTEHEVDAEGAIREGRLQLLPPGEFYAQVADGELGRRGLAEGFPSVRVAAEARSAMRVVSDEDYMKIEYKMDFLCRDAPFSALCQYDRFRLSGPRLATAAASHPFGIRDRLLHTGGGPDQFLLSGEPDIANAALLREALRSAARDAGRVLRVDLSRVRFISVAGVRALLEATEDFRLRGGEVILAAPQRPVAPLLVLLEVDHEPNLRLDVPPGS